MSFGALLLLLLLLLLLSLLLPLVPLLLLSALCRCCCCIAGLLLLLAACFCSDHYQILRGAGWSRMGGPPPRHLKPTLKRPKSSIGTRDHPQYIAKARQLR